MLRCQTSSSIWTLRGDQPVIPGVPFIRLAMALPFGTTGSLNPAFAPARPVCLTVKLPYTFTLYRRFLFVMREPLNASVTFWEATTPVKLPTRQCPSPGLRVFEVRFSNTQGRYFKVDSSEANASPSQSPAYPTQINPKINAKL